VGPRRGDLPGAALGVAVRQPRKPETPKDRAVADRVRRARTPNRRSIEYCERCGALANALGVDPGDVFEEFDDRAWAREVGGGNTRDEAERLAFLDVLERYERLRAG
jgi:hypothetical protein